MKILILGENGFIGRNLKEKLRADGHIVASVFGQMTGFDYKSFDAVINCAGQTEVTARMFNDNVEFAVRYGMVCFYHGVRYIHLGSVLEESDFKGARQNVYVATKRAATDLLTAYAKVQKSNYAVLRLSTVYGNDDKPTSFLPTLWDAFVNNKTFELVDAERDWIHMDDVYAAVLTLIQNPEAIGVYTAGSGKFNWNHELLQKFEEQMNRKVTVNHRDTQWSGWKASNVAMERLGWYPKVNLDKGIAKFIEYKTFESSAFLGAEA